MRVLVVPKWYPWPEQPVLGIFCREHARAISLEHDVVVLASRAERRPPFPLFSLSEGTEEGLATLRVRYRRPRLRPLGLVWQAIGMVVALGRLRRRGWKPDLVHAHVYSAALPALLLARLCRAPLVVTEHYTGFERGLIKGSDRLTARLAFRGAALVAPVSEPLAEHVRALAPATPVEVVPNTVDVDAFHPGTGRSGTAGERPLRLLNVAALAEKKGQRDLLEALRELPDAELELIGEGDQRGPLERQAAAEGLSERVHFRGEVPKAAVAAAMRDADLFVLPSRHENLPCVLIEALASGLPAVATAVGGVPGLIDAQAGVLCPPGDPAALGAAIRVVAGRLDEYDPAAMSARARERFGYRAIAARWTRLYEQLTP